MTRVLTIKGRTGLFDIPSFLLSENESLKIKIVTDELRLGKFRLCVKHGKNEKVYSLKTKDEIELHPVWLNANKENLEFSLVFLNPTETEILKSDYQIEPLKLERVEGNFAYTAMLQEIIEKQEALDERLLKAEEKIRSFEDNGVPLAFEE